MKAPTLLLIGLALGACGKTGAPANPVDAAARRICMDTIEARATNSKSISYLSGDAAPIPRDAKGQLDVSIKFSAKNDIGGASTITARCVVSADGKALVDFSAREAR